jgi:NADH-quinone oxidoreductase subunit F
LDAEPFLLRDPAITTLDGYRASGGGEGLQRARELGPEQTVKEILLSGLRGRGGAGFRTGRKWETILRSSGSIRYVVCNAAEGEPGSFKDRALMRANPYQIVEGVAIAALTVGAREAFICLKARFAREVAAMTGAAQEMERAGLIGDLAVTIVEGPEEYLYGEEKALLEVIEGKAPLPRLFPPYEQGLFAVTPQMGWEPTPRDPIAMRLGVTPAAVVAEAESNPTLVNNAETLANVPVILARGAEWYHSLGVGESRGHVICTIVGDVRRAGVAEIELGLPLSQAIDEIGGGPGEGHRIKAVFSGVSNAAITSDELDTPLTYEDFRAIDSGLGSVGFMVYDESACMVDLAQVFARFLYVESCGQCPACKFGTGEVTGHLERLLALQATELDIEIIGARLRTVTDGNRCALPVEAQQLLSSFLRDFPEEFADHLEGRRCTGRHDLPLPKIDDIVDGLAVYDRRQALKRPDWSYAEQTAVPATGI